MGDWSDYFEDFPEENPSNYDENGRYMTPEQHAERARINAQVAARKLNNPNNEINHLIQDTLVKNPIHDKKQIFKK